MGLPKPKKLSSSVDDAVARALARGGKRNPNANTVPAGKMWNNFNELSGFRGPSKPKKPHTNLNGRPING
jgi:hypothetical protein